MTIPKQAKLIITLCCLCGLMAACNKFGAIGDTINFRTTKPQLETAIDSLYAKYPQYKLPAKWAKYNNFPVKNPEYLETKIFYFKSQPEEMYYISLIDDSVMTGDSARTGLAIRAVNRGDGTLLKEDNIDFEDGKRMEKRFNDEIVSKLEALTKTKAKEEE